MKNFWLSSIMALFIFTVGHSFAVQHVNHHRTTQKSDFDQRTNQLLTDITTTKQSALQKKIQEQNDIIKNPLGIMFFKPTYILPFYYTGSPYQAIYEGNTPDNQRVMKSEFKGQISLQVPVWRNIFNKRLSLNVAYTEMSYWQFYAKSQYFRETNYEPELFLSSNFHQNWLANFGVVHQSNGRGGDLERSWNRAYTDIQFSGVNWLVSIKPWVLIFKGSSSDLHNPDIARYLGHERILFVYKLPKDIELSFNVRNLERSKYTTLTSALSFPIFGKLSGYVQFFSGYGQSLIEYDHHTNSIGVGIALHNWL